jgi:hypothetical protein
MIQNKTEVLNLKSRKIQIPIGYLTQILKKNHKNSLTATSLYFSIPWKFYSVVKYIGRRILFISNEIERSPLVISRGVKWSKKLK